MACMETNHDKPLFTNHVTLLLSLILPEHSWTKNIILGASTMEWWSKNWCKEDLAQERWGFPPKNTVQTLKHGGGSMLFWARFSSRRTGQKIGIWGIMKSEDYIKILNESLQLST